MGPGNLSGVLKITLTARTPLLIGGFSRPGPGGARQRDVPRRADGTASHAAAARMARVPGTAMVPGSGLMGAVRSLHEALAGGCLRVLNSDWRPVHRHPANTAETDGLRLAVVTEVDAAGRATRVRLCDPPIWIHRDLLPADGGRLPRTGDRVKFGPADEEPRPIPEKALVASGNRKVLLRPDRERPDRERPDRERPDRLAPGDLVRTGGMGTTLDDSWVLLVTDTKAREDSRPVFFAAGRIGPGAPGCQIPPDTWNNYAAVVAGADDLRPASLKRAGFPDGKEPAWGTRQPEYEDVCWPPQDPGDPPQDPGSEERRAIAQRLRARSYLHPGQPVWVRVAEDRRTVTEIRLSQLWRYQGEGTAGDRAGRAKPCTDPERLCWSCRIFGSADVEGRGAGDRAVQKSYQGHVRFDDLLAVAPFEPRPWPLAPLASPRPSAGQFYLDHAAVPPGQRLAGRNARPAATWGSLADSPDDRPIRGRKFYWRTPDPTAGQFPRGQHREHQSEELSGTVPVIPAGTVFTGRVCFDNLSPADYGSLLAALDPRLMTGPAGDGTAGDGTAGDGWDQTVTSIGGGKPFGFGAVDIDVKPVLVQTAKARYLGETEPVPSTAEAVLAFRNEVPRKVSVTWQALRHALTSGFVPDDLVWYPPGPNGAKGSMPFDQSFEFFNRTAGLELSDKVRELVELPDAAGPAEAQVLDSRDGERPRDQGREGRRQSRG